MKNFKTLIIAIVGQSGSGKTYMVDKLSKSPYNVPVICSYTTREKRPDETNGVQHYFVNLDLYKKCKKSKDIFAETKFGGNRYWTTLTQILDFPYCLYVIDEKGLVELEEKTQHELKDKISIYKIYVDRPLESRINNIDKDRLSRDLNRKFLPWSYYNNIIVNDSTLEEFDKNIDYVYTHRLKSLISQYE